MSTFETPYENEYICEKCLALYGELHIENCCQQCGEVGEYGPMVHDWIWKQLVEDSDLFLCAGCMDERARAFLGRDIRPNDLTNAPVNHDLYPELMRQQCLPWAV